MATKPENARYEARQRAIGLVRGPRITAEASEALRFLSAYIGKEPREIVSELIVREWRESNTAVAHAMREHRMSECEAREFVRGRAA